MSVWFDAIGQRGKMNFHPKENPICNLIFISKISEKRAAKLKQPEYIFHVMNFQYVHSTLDLQSVILRSPRSTRHVKVFNM